MLLFEQEEEDMKKITIVICILAAVMLTIMFVLKYNLNKTRTQMAIIEQSNVLSQTEFIDQYTTTGTTITIYVSDLWLVSSNTEHINWCKNLGLQMDKIYCKCTKKNLGNIYMHIYIHNDNGTVSELAWYKPSGEVELYYKH